MMNLSLEIPDKIVEPVYTTGYHCQTTPTSDSDSLPDFLPLENDWMNEVSYGFDHDAFFRETTHITDVSYNTEGNVYMPTTPPGRSSAAAINPPSLIRKRRFQHVYSPEITIHENPLIESIANGHVSLREFHSIELAIDVGHVRTRARPENPHIRMLEESKLHPRATVAQEDVHLDALDTAIKQGRVGIRQK